jgi:hypothetical protein
MSINVIGSIWRNLKKRKKMYLLSQQIPIQNFKPRNGYVVTDGDILQHSPQKSGVSLLFRSMQFLTWKKSKKASPYSATTKNEKLRFIVNNKIYSNGSIY